MVFREIAAVVVVGLGDVPHIEALVHDVHAELVAGAEDRAAAGVVGAANAVVTRLFEDADPALGRSVKLAGAEDPVVVVDARAAELDLLPVHADAGLGAPAELADAEEEFLRVSGAFDTDAIEERVLRVPEPGVGDRDIPECTLGHECISVVDADFRPLRRVARHSDDGGIDGFGLDTDLRQMLLGLDRQPYRPIDAAAAVPAAVGLETVVDVDQQLVCPGVDLLAEVHLELRVAVGVKREGFPVEGYRCVPIDALKNQGDAFADIRFLDLEIPLVHIPAAGEIARVRPVQALAARLRDHGVMGQVDRHGARRVSMAIEAPAPCKFLFH